MLLVAAVVALLAAGAGSCARPGAAPHANAVPSAPGRPSDYWVTVPRAPSAPSAARCFAALAPSRGVPAGPSRLWLAAGAGVAAPHIDVMRSATPSTKARTAC